MGILGHVRRVVMVLVFSASVQAMPVMTVSYERVDSSSDPIVIDLAEYSAVTENGPDSVTYIGWYAPPDDAWFSEWDLEVTNDTARGGSSLFIFLTYAVISNTDTALDFQNVVTLQGTLPGPTAISGSVSGSIGDTSGDGNGATLSETSTGDPFYTALIDDVPVWTLLDAPYEFTAPPDLTDPWDGLDYVGETWYPAVNSTIAIEHSFRLSAHDSVAITSTMLVIPEPATVAFLMIGGSAILLRRRR